jgi:hypothetical protein
MRIYSQSIEYPFPVLVFFIAFVIDFYELNFVFFFEISFVDILCQALFFF